MNCSEFERERERERERVRERERERERESKEENMIFFFLLNKEMGFPKGSKDFK